MNWPVIRKACDAVMKYGPYIVLCLVGIVLVHQTPAMAFGAVGSAVVLLLAVVVDMAADNHIGVSLKGSP